MKQSNNAPAGARRGPRCPLATAALAALALGAAGLTAGCVGTVGAEGFAVYGHPVVRATLVPVEIDAYPRVYYRGTYAYLVDGAWYYPTDRGWVVFEEEPLELRRYRESARPSPRYVAPEREHGYPRERGRRYYTPR